MTRAEDTCTAREAALAWSVPRFPGTVKYPADPMNKDAVPAAFRGCAKVSARSFSVALASQGWLPAQLKPRCVMDAVEAMILLHGSPY